MLLWGRRILVIGLIMALVSATPALLITLMPTLGEGFLGTVAILLTITVTPLGAAFVSAGAFLLLAGLVRRVLSGRAPARAASPPAPPPR
jgi:hypothetical protein